MPDSKVKVLIVGEDNFSATFSKFGENLASIKNSLTSFLEVAGAASAFEFVDKISESADAMGRMSQKTGVAVEDLSALNFAATMNDVSLETLSKGLERLSKALVGGDLSPKGQAAAKAIAALGVSTHDANGKLLPLTEILGNLADKFKNQIPANERAGYAMTVFGKAGAELLPVLLQGSTGLKQLEDQAKSLGKTLSEDDVEQARQFQDSLKLLKAEGEGLSTQFVEGLLPSINGTTQALVGFNGQSGVAREAGSILGEVVRTTALLFTDLAYSTDLAVLKGEKFLQWADKMNHRFNPLGAAAADKIFGKLPDFGDLDAQVAELDKNFGKLWADLENPPQLKTSSSGANSDSPMADAVSAIGDAAVTSQDQLASLFDLIDAQGKTTLDVLNKARNERDLIANGQKDLDELNARIKALQTFLSDHPGQLFPQINQQLKDLKAQASETEKALKDISDVPKIGTLPGDPTLSPLPITPGKAALEKQAEDMAKVHQLYGQIGEDVGKSIEQSLLYGKSWSKTFEQLFIEIGLAIIKFEVLKAVEAAGGGGGGFWGGLLNGLLGGHAQGGHMNAGEVSWVGEQGPEVFQPDTSGTVIPMSKLGGGGGDVYNTYDFRGADPGSEARIMQSIKQMGMWARSGAVGDVRDLRRRGISG